MKRLIDQVIYTYRPGKKVVEYQKKSISVIGIDTEALESGKCFLISTSLGDSFPAGQFPACLFSRKYIDKHFVAYNLSYDEGAFLQWLPKTEWHLLWKEHKVEYAGYRIKIIPKKFLRIQKKGHGITFWDMANFFPGGLDYNAKKYLDDAKIHVSTKTFTKDYVKKHWKSLCNYCVQDAVLVERLANYLIKTCEEFGVYPKKLFSTAYISFDYFKKYTKYPTVDKLWYANRKVLEFAMLAYNGGKFEVTTKGTGEFWEYDIVSAYPNEIQDLVDITDCHVVWNRKYDKQAVYSFLECDIEIPLSCHSPVALDLGGVNIYPCGHIRKVITKKEYDYLLECGSDIVIHDACHIYVKKKIYPFRKEIRKLIEWKKKYKTDGNKFKYQLCKIIMNSLYGKMIQFIPKGDKWVCGQSWNPIYASVITANVRITVSRMQNKYADIWAVHTDSIISRKKLDIEESPDLGGWTLECQGKGLILGSGIYQIADNVKFRGFCSKKDLWTLCDTDQSTISVNIMKAITWREVAFHNWSPDMVNRFVETVRNLRIRFDRKRLWIDDYNFFREILERNVSSLPVVF